MAIYPTFTPTRPGGNVPPRYANPSGFSTGPAYSMVAGGGGYSNPGAINDPTLAPGGGYGGYGVGGSPTNVGGLPPGAIKPPFQFQGGGIPNYMASQGWRVVRGPDGSSYWAPPGGQQQQAQSHYIAF